MKKIKGLTDEEDLKLRATLKLHRRTRHLTPLETSSLIQKSIIEGETLKSLSNKLNVHESQLQRIRALNAIINEKIRSAIVWGQPKKGEITMTSAGQLQRIKDQNIRLIIFYGILKNNFNRFETNELVSLYKRSGKPIKDCIKQVLNARPKTITTILIQGKFLSQKLIDHLKTIVPFERNKLFNSLIKNNFPDIIFQGQKLGNKSFVIIGNDETLEYLNNIEGGYEEKIENLLLKEFGI